MRSAELCLCVFLSLGVGCSPSPPRADPEGPDSRQERTALPTGEAAAIGQEIRALLERQAAAWNEGDLAAFVGDYLDSPEMRFVSGGSVRYGSADVLDRYRRTYPDRAAMGTLRFAELDVRVLSSGFVFVFGRYHLAREHDAPTGLFTLLFVKTAAGWKIAHDHTSSD